MNDQTLPELLPRLMTARLMLRPIPPLTFSAAVPDQVAAGAALALLTSRTAADSAGLQQAGRLGLLPQLATTPAHFLHKHTRHL
jgi:hypothetical protein